ncbi:hypothetical protein IWX76_001536 [Pedobacter sp. CAN_A7]|uniref:FecR family protein n=1 Tax=Pedobacter sp. CAN_A7 TaxID=2787722 RepID=UPI0018CACB5D
MNQIEFNTLLEKYTAGICSHEELMLLESWYLAKAKQNPEPSLSAEDLYFYKKAIWKDIQRNTQKTHRPRWPAILAAASVILILTFGFYHLFNQQLETTTKPAKTLNKDLLPGSNKAVLILSNGKQISLSDSTTLSYKNGSHPLGYSPSGYNTIQTPNGGQWPSIELPDGTKVFLDAASSVTFPVSFDKERKVTLTGQAYFQVVHQSKKPFFITVKGLTIEDLGTDFNVNAHDDEPTVKTTLIEGSVSVSNKSQKIILIPGQQATATAGNGKIIASEANVEEVLAWKNGLFQFNRTPIAVVMLQIARWYNVDIVYKNDVSNITFTGNLPRNLKASRLLEMLSITGLHFNIGDKKIIVSAN